MPGDSENVRVAVRVRPFNAREKQRNAKLIIEMQGAQTIIKNPEDPAAEPKKFNFDYSYWSHDGFKEEANGLCVPDASHPSGKKYADQSQVFKDLGEDVLNSAWSGYNTTLFAYGQTGAGKSYSVVGYGANRGIVNQFCVTLFSQIQEKAAADSSAEYEVSFSMLEIYNEQVRDLLNPASNKKGGLKVRQHAKKGFYAENLKTVPVASYQEIDRRMEEGTTNRTVAATNMNATSSRAHTIIGITFVQKFQNAAGETMAKTAIINLVDLAGSERAESTGATGDRLKEGAAINLSLSSLGNVISALVDQANGKKVRVPYRDSVLTKLLKNALGGNSKTTMIAAISPADINYDESLSTLRYADRAKQIKNNATVNEDPTAKLIRDLQEENDKLKKLLESGGGASLVSNEDMDNEDTTGMSQEEIDKIRQEMAADFEAQLEENRREMERKLNFADQLKEAQEHAVVDSPAEKAKKEVHMYNLNMDPQLSGKIIHFFDASKSIGNQKGDNDIVLMGPSIQNNHASISVDGGKYFMEKSNTDAKLLRNGEHVTEKVQLKHNDRLMFGTTQLYVFSIPAEKDPKAAEVTYEDAQQEIAANIGFDMNTENKSKDDMLLQEDLIDMIPAVGEANAISEALDKKKRFEIILVSPEARGEREGRTKVYVKIVDVETDLEWIWPQYKFLNKKYVMQEMYEKFQDGELEEMPKDTEDDPFFIHPDKEMHIGSVKVWLQSLAYHIEIQEQLEVTDYRGSNIGLLNVSIVPCNKKGKEYTEDDDVWVDDPKSMVGREMHFNVKIESARGLPSMYTDYFAKFQVYLDDREHETKKVANTSNPDWKFTEKFTFNPVTDQFSNFLMSDSIMIQIWAKQKPPKSKKTVSTKDALAKQVLARGQLGTDGGNQKKVDADKVKFMMNLAITKKRAEKAEQKVGYFRQLIQTAEELGKARVSTNLLKVLLQAPNKDVAEKCIKLVEKEKGAESDLPPARRQQGNSSLCVLL